MPPGDTIYFKNGVLIRTDTTDVSPQTQELIDSILESYRGQPIFSRKDPPQFIMPEWAMFLVVVGILAFLFLIYIGIPFYLKKRKQKITVRKLIDKNAVFFHTWLTEHNPYYDSLPGSLKEIFLQRTVEFMSSKDFHFHKMDAHEKIPLLISAAAVQVTFGLKKYRMDFFRRIHVMGNEYKIKSIDHTYWGHVSKTGIHISWRHFEIGFDNYTDAHNMGIHEMAHALSFDLFLGFPNKEDSFLKNRLREFRENERATFQKVKRTSHHILYEYGSENFDEFWAVSIEHFFENPLILKQSEPGLYRSICEMLNQDPLTNRKILDYDAAGINSSSVFF